jgi:(1->4)-alpha-D-glucan 1-alpha-D-glucosylmutase
MNAPPAPPRATYRLQLHAGFTFHDAAAIVPYLAKLGISHVYCSPFLKARPGSTHGYDIVDHSAFNPELGGEEGFDALSAALDAHGLGLILDFVPNHMGVLKADNAWWRDVLRWGRASPFAHYFDVDWEAQKTSLSGKVMLPVLGGHYGDVLNAGELKCRFDADAGGFVVCYYEHGFPLRLEDDAMLAAEAARWGGGERLAEVARLLEEAAHAVDPRAAAMAAEARLVRLAADDNRARAALDAAAIGLEGKAGHARSWTGLHRVLERQHYRLAHWRASADEINYRRFFDVDDLAGLRIEEPDLFQAAHALVGRLIASGRLHGLRIDHVDGLHDPEAYLRHLVGFAEAQRPRGAPPTYLVVEKILARSERLPGTWPVDGTTGYDWLNLAGGLFVDPDAAASLETTYWSFVRAPMAYPLIERDSKARVIDTMLSSGINTLATELDRISEDNWRTRDYTRAGLLRALIAIVIGFDVYRTYVSGQGVSAEDRARLDGAVRRARRDWRGPDRDILDFVRGVLNLDLAREPTSGFDAARLADFAQRFQQYSGPVMAKSVEDTAFYRYYRLVALNEVGGHPDRFGTSPEAFHADAGRRATETPHAMLATSTHDTKRGEDVRMRISVLSEVPDLWAARVRRWQDLNRAKQVADEGILAPSRNDEFMIYQTLIGIWPVEVTSRADLIPDVLGPLRERMSAYVLKAAREAKLETSWAAPDQAYESALPVFLDRLLDPASDDPFLDELIALAAPIARYGAMNGLGLTALKLTAPGVPDIYQGTELIDLSLVDPDNRRPVDYGARAARLDEGGGSVPAFDEGWEDGAAKLALVARLLALRKQLPDLLADGAYVPLVVEGPTAPHALAFARTHGGRCLVVCVGRLMARLDAFGGGPYGPDRWRGTRLHLPDGVDSWTDVLADSDAPVPHDGTGMLEVLMERLPVAILLGSRSESK